MNKDIVQNVVIALLISAIGYIFSSIGELKHNQDLHGSAAEERNKYMDKKIEGIEANNLKQWDVIDARTEKEETQEVNIAKNGNNIKHLQEESRRE